MMCSALISSLRNWWTGEKKREMNTRTSSQLEHNKNFRFSFWCWKKVHFHSFPSTRQYWFLLLCFSEKTNVRHSSVLLPSFLSQNISFLFNEKHHHYRVYRTLGETDKKEKVWDSKERKKGGTTSSPGEWEGENSRFENEKCSKADKTKEERMTGC